MWSTWEVMFIIAVAASFGGCLGCLMSAMLFASRESGPGSEKKNCVAWDLFSQYLKGFIVGMMAGGIIFYGLIQFWGG